MDRGCDFMETLWVLETIREICKFSNIHTNKWFLLLSSLLLFHEILFVKVEKGAVRLPLIRSPSSLPFKEPLFPSQTVYIPSACGHRACLCFKYLLLESQLEKAKQKNPLAFWELNPQKMLFATCRKHKVQTAGTGLVPGSFTVRERGGLKQSF